MEERCYGCNESDDISYDGVCFLCWEELTEHLEEEM